MKLPVSSANPSLLRWARSTAGLSVQEVVRKANISGLSQITAEERLLSLEDGSATPTLSQLKGLAKVYRRPLVTFFLAEPPVQMEPLMDYRTATKVSHESVEFSALKRRILQLHRELSAIANDEQTVPLSFVGSCKFQDGALTTVDAIRRILSISPADLLNKSSDDTFRILRDKAQEAGVYILLMSDLGNYKSQINPDEFRGIAIADKLVPLIVVNKNDTDSAMLFTLVHELAHIFLGSSGVSNLDVFESRPSHKAVEQFCNAVAAELLVPEEMLRSSWDDKCEELESCVAQLAHNFGVSKEVISRRLYDLGVIEESEYRRIIGLYKARWEHHKLRNSTTKGGPNSNTLLRYNLGKNTLSTLSRAVDDGLISILDAARALDMTVSRFEKVAK